MTITRRIAVLGAATGLVLSAGLAQAAVEIQYWQYFFDARIKAMEKLIASFEAENPGVTVKMTHFPYADYRTKVAAAIPAGEGPDVVQLFYGWLNDYVKAGLIQPLPTNGFAPERIEAEFYPMVQAMKLDGAYWALPTAVRSLALFYNERLMDQAGVKAAPATLDDLVTAAKAMTQKDGAGNLTAVGLTSGMTAQDHHWLREVLFRQFGAQPYSADNRTVTYDTAAGRAALQWYVDLQKAHGVTQVGFMDEPQAAFRAGRAGLHIDGSFRIGALKGERGLKWGVAPLPAGPGGTQSNYASYWVNAVTSKAEGEKRDAALKFMAHVTSDAAMRIWLDETGELPAKPSAAQPAADDPIYGPFVKGLEAAQTTIFADESGQRQVFVDMLNRILLENQSVADALAQAAKEEQALLDRYYAAN